MSKKDNESKEMKVGVIHVKQLHLPNPLPADFDLSSLVEVARSQLNVAKAILEHSHAAVLSESLLNDLTPENKEARIKHAEAARQCFPDGLPKDVSGLKNINQIWALAMTTAPLILYDLGSIDCVYKNYDQKEIDSIKESSGNNKAKAMIEEREILTLKEAQKIAIKSGKNTILMVYGREHNFKRRIRFEENSNLFFEKEIFTCEYDLSTLSAISFEKLCEQLNLEVEKPISEEELLQRIEKMNENSNMIPTLDAWLNLVNYFKISSESPLWPKLLETLSSLFLDYLKVIEISPEFLSTEFKKILTGLDDDARCISVFQAMQEKFPKILRDEKDFDEIIHVHFAPKQREVFKKIWSLNNGEDKPSVSSYQNGSPRLFTLDSSDSPAPKIEPVESQLAELS